MHYLSQHNLIVNHPKIGKTHYKFIFNENKEMLTCNKNQNVNVFSL